MATVGGPAGGGKVQSSTQMLADVETLRQQRLLNLKTLSSVIGQ